MTIAKFIVLGMCCVTLGLATIGTGILFASYNLSVARNPEEAEELFNTTLMAFALIETFVFLSFLLVFIAFTI